MATIAPTSTPSTCPVHEPGDDACGETLACPVDRRALAACSECGRHPDEHHRNADLRHADACETYR